MDPHPDIPSRTRRALALAWAVACLMPGGAAAQTPERAIEFEDLGFTATPDVSARGLALSGFAAGVCDASAVVYNPAGLARVKRHTPMLTLARRTADLTTTYDGAPGGLSSQRFGLQFVGAAAPLPAIRGSLVPAAAVYRAFASDLDLQYSGYNWADRREDSFRLQQSGSTFAFTLGVGLDLASAVSCGLAIVAMEGGFHALRQYRTLERNPPPTVHTFVIDEITGDVDGIGGRVGVELFAHRHLQVGVAFTTPFVLSVSTDQTREETRQVQNDVGTFVRTSSSTDTEYTIPYRVDGAVAVPMGAWLLALQAGTSDWSLAAIDRSRPHLQSGDSVLGRVVEWRAGVEWTTPWWPLRLRAGAARVPFASRYLQVDRIDNDRLESVTEDSAPMRYSGGAALLLRGSITIDAAYSRTTGDRRSAHLAEARAASLLLVQGAYWF